MRAALADRCLWKIRRKKPMLRKTTLALFFIASFLFVATSVFAQNTKLIEAAKKEGKAIAYGSLESDTMEAIVNGFKKKTGLEVEYWRASATTVMDRALSEARAGRPTADLIITNDNPLRLMQKENLFQKYASPTAKDFP